MDHLVEMKDSLIIKIENARGVFNCKDGFDEAVMILRKVFYALNLVAPLWRAENYGYKIGELVERIENILRDNTPEKYAPKKAETIKELKNLAMATLRGEIPAEMF